MSDCPTSPYSEKTSPYSEKTSPYSATSHCYVLLQETGYPLLFEDGSQIRL